MKVLCPRHQDTSPSCEVYENGAYCFSGCGNIPLEELGLDPSSIPPRPKEDLEQTLREIQSLPTGAFRGFQFPYDHKGFYICWPNAPFYKKRLFDPKAKAKYIAPSGHKPPLFWAQKEYQEILCIVEGELEALSVAAALPVWDVVSPGGASQFISGPLLKACKRYDTTIVAVDNDPAGIKAAQDLVTILIDFTPKVVVLYKDKERDFNKVFCDQGIPALRDEIEKRLYSGVCWENRG